jgi:hypothetical protein
MSTIHTTLLLVACCLCSGCIALPPAENTATTCTRNYREVSGEVHARGSDLRKNIEAKCVDDAKHRTTASDTTRLGRNEAAKAATYDARDGENRTQVKANTHVSGIGFSSTTEVVKENKYFRWGARIRVRSP